MPIAARVNGFIIASLWRGQPKVGVRTRCWSRSRFVHVRDHVPHFICATVPGKEPMHETVCPDIMSPDVSTEIAMLNRGPGHHGTAWPGVEVPGHYSRP